jgi:hypothetical protein
MLGNELAGTSGARRRCTSTLALVNRNGVTAALPRGVRRRVVGGVTAQDAFHLILQVQLVLFQSDFFDLFGLLKKIAGGEVVDSFVEVVVQGGQVAVFIVALQQFTLQLFEVFRHLRLLGEGSSSHVVGSHAGKLPQDPGTFKDAHPPVVPADRGARG